MSSHSSLLLSAVPPLVLGTATAQFFEAKWYTDDGCEELAMTEIINGADDSIGSEAFDACTDLAGLNLTYSYGMYECTDNKAMLSFYDSETCSGDAAESTEFSNSTCDDAYGISTTSRCITEDPQWTILNDWTLDATFYEDEDCTTPTGNSTQYSISEFNELTNETSVCGPPYTGASSNLGVQCIEGNLGFALYGESDTTCSLDFTYASKYETDFCWQWWGDDGQYVVASCTADSDGEGDSDDERDSDDEWDSDGAVSLLAGGAGCYAWSIAVATAATVLASLFA